MKAHIFHAYGPPSSMRYEEVPNPGPPAPGHVLVRTVAAGVNPADGRLASGEYPGVWSSFPRINGRDIAGIVEAVGPDVTDFQPGDLVYGFSEVDAAGTWADIVPMPIGQIARAPRTISLVEAAALPVVAVTAWMILFRDFGVEAGQTLLVNGAAGGVGSMVVQMARNAGLKVIGTASTGKLPYLRELGCDQVIDYTTVGVESVVSQVDAVVDTVGGAALATSYKLVRPGGWLASVSGEVDRAVALRCNIRALTVRGRVEGDVLDRIAAEVDAGRLKVQVSQTFPMPEAVAALRQVLEGHTLGKVVLVNE
jgi:NADPH:quinone reductase-like Zn-dependent oxidoreductase